MSRPSLPLSRLAPVAAALLSDFVCTPFAMQGARHCAAIADLQAISADGLRDRARLLRLRTDMDDEEPDGDEGEGCPPWEAPIYSITAGIAQVDVSGPIVKGYDPLVCWFFGLMSLDRLQSAVLELGGRADVAAVVFKFNSPGGMASGTPETAEMIAALGAVKPTIGYTSDMACSAAYWLASACDVLLATPSATVGSIGTYLALYDYSAYLEQCGIKLELFRAGALKGIGVMGKTLSVDEKKFLQSCVDRINSRFTGFVTSRRPGVADSTMQGQWFDGEQAVELGLVDAVVTTEAEIMRHLATRFTAA